MKTFYLLLMMIFALAGCASADYKEYADAQVAMTVARSNAEAERYRSMAAVAQSGDTTVKVAAMMSMASSPGSASSAPAMQAPKAWDEKVLTWLGITMNPLSSAYAAHQQVKLGIAQSNNSVKLGESNNNMILGMAREIQAPAASYTFSASGEGAVAGSGTANTNHNPVTGSYNPISGSYNPTTDSNNPAVSTPTVVQIPAGQTCAIVNNQYVCH